MARRKKDYNIITQESHDNFTLLIDDADSTTTYIGKTFLGNPTSLNKWQIRKLTVVGTVTSIGWAGGDDDFNQVWDDRASLSYS